MTHLLVADISINHVVAVVPVGLGDHLLAKGFTQGAVAELCVWGKAASSQGKQFGLLRVRQ